MTGLSPSRRLLGAVAVSLVLAGILASCGESRTVTTASAVVVAPAPVAQITMPPDRTPAAAVESPTPRVAEAIVAVTPVTAIPTAVAAAEPTEAAAAAETPAAIASLSGAAEEGRKQFTALGCIACHGTDLSGGIGPELRKRTVEDLPEERIRSQAMQGGAGMPAFPNLTEQELQNFIAFIRSQA
ncbi:MAG: cytochrome c [Chloroflexota bacterium]|nr:cytochrome c [Chloroflexota bacterium]MDE2918793.1 cytochrome c [Chloroflexota bacterium]